MQINIEIQMMWQMMSLKQRGLHFKSTICIFSPLGIANVTFKMRRFFFVLTSSMLKSQFRVGKTKLLHFYLSLKPRFASLSV